MALRIRNLRLAVQHGAFAVLMYGGRFGVHLGPALPCFACPFVPGCGGFCYLMGLQGYIGFGLGVLSAPALWAALGWLAVFIFLVALLGKAWCGWLCPFGLLQDWLTALRRRLGLREGRVSEAGHHRLAPIKYGLLASLAVLPPLISAGLLPEDFYLPFCNICPGKALLPLFAGETKYLALNLDNAVTLGFSLALQITTGAFLAGMFFKERFFCVFCPLLALIHLLKPLTALGLSKEPPACVGCGQKLFRGAVAAVDEISANAAGLWRLSGGEARHILNIGGQDMKALTLDDRGRVADFKMNDKCAAGTGRFTKSPQYAVAYGAALALA